ncbi:enoyl-CoA hydratase-related protein [Noviherbaspirillum saxi]|uniref:Enoyl-CoA hydratase n=1 Tax=Noviherbaspirillum saxi TaxID=2320863 RepID=A0A3A3FJT7_9BURK|nr:enoyl-CoA hydratase-related protein [Noviherbaspirillum saxi]RJF95454.1 enoyl-CoA hydratase [Noviherbaspirillum saxi]
MAELVMCEIVDGIAAITLNRPDNGNALDSAMGRALITAVNEVISDKSVRTVMLTGSGKSFCVGGDIAEMRSANDLSVLMEAAISELHALIRMLKKLPIPVISALNGPIGGGGIGLALCADIVLAAESMKLRGGYSAIGLTPDLGASYLLAARAGAARAKEILLMNEPIGARQCLEWGIVNAVLPDAELHSEAWKHARRLASGASLSFGRIKHLVDGAATRSLDDHLTLEEGYMIASARSADGKEGVAAFMEKRRPYFTAK